MSKAAQKIINGLQDAINGDIASVTIDGRTFVRRDALLPLVEAMDQLLDDMGHNGTSVCLAAKAQARIAFEPFLDPEAREFIMSLEDAQRIAKEAGL